MSPIFEFLSKTSGRNDLRLSVCSILLGLGIPVSVGWDYGGILGLSDGNLDLMVTILSYNWSLKHLKLVFLNSI